jgi:hypothetical protein
MNDLNPLAHRPPNLGATPSMRWLRVAGAAGVVGLIALAAPVVWLAAAGGVGLLVLGVLALVGAAALRALPLLGQKLENRLLAARKAEARGNPIEQMQNHAMHRARQVAVVRESLINIRAQIETLQDRLDERRRQAPQHDLRKQEAGLLKMRQFHDAYLGKLDDAERALEDYRRHVETKSFEWEFALAGNEVLRQLDAADQERALRELLADEATREVQRAFNRTFAALDVEVRNLAATPRLEFGPGLQLDLPAVDLRETPVEVAR